MSAAEKSAVSLTEYPLCMTSHFSLVDFKVVFWQTVFGVEIFEVIELLDV